MTYKRIGKEDVEAIESGLKTHNNASSLAKDLNLDVSGLIKHIKNHLVYKMTNLTNKCGLCRECELTSICPECRKKEGSRCASCRIQNCNQVCPSYTKKPNCRRVNKFPYCCNGCPKSTGCHLNHVYYDSAKAWASTLANRSEPRKGTHADKAELQRLSSLLVPLIIGKKQSLDQVFQTHSDEIRWTKQTILSYIDAKLIPGLANIDLPKRVKYPKGKRKKGYSGPTNAAFLSGRTYDDFVAFATENKGVSVVEMDTVVSCAGSDCCVLTLLFRSCNFMLAFLLKEKTSKEVSRAFRLIRAALGNELYSKAFGCVLTDNGTEFANPVDIEMDPETGEVLTRLFYCDPGKSGQKGKIEKNHVELRKVFPKGTDFSLFTQKQLNLALRHINSEPRSVLNHHSPGKIAELFVDKKVLALNEYSPIDPDEVFLSPKLLKSK